MIHLRMVNDGNGKSYFFFLFLFQLLLLKMPNNLSKPKMPAYGKLLPMKITGRIFFLDLKRNGAARFWHHLFLERLKWNAFQLGQDGQCVLYSHGNIRYVFLSACWCEQPRLPVIPPAPGFVDRDLTWDEGNEVSGMCWKRKWKYSYWKCIISFGQNSLPRSLKIYKQSRTKCLGVS